MMRWFKIGIVVVVGGVLCYMLYSIITTLQHKQEVAEKRQNVPSFHFYQLDSTQYSHQQLPTDRPLVIVYFNPECGDCEYQWESIKEHRTQLNDIYFLLISSASKIAMREFYQKQSLDQYSNIKLLMDPEEKFYKIFGTRSYPTLFIYNSSHQLVKKFDRAVKAEAILKALSQDA